MKLLTYSSRKYIWVSAILILLSIPIFYLVVNTLFIQAIDKSLKNQAYVLPSYIKEINSPDELELWKKLDNDVEIKVFDKNSYHPNPFTGQEENPKTNELEDYRYLQKQINIFGIKHTITFKTSLVEKEDLLRSILIVQVSLLVLIFIGFMVTNITISKKIWNPFNQILTFLKNYQLSKENGSVPQKMIIDEFNELSNEINLLLQRTETAYQLQKEFTENAAHELQTPVAIIKSKLDLLLQEKGLSNNQSVLIDQIYYVLQKLSDLNKNLLFLSKLENQQFDFEDDIEVASTVNLVIDNLNFFAEAKYQQLIFNRPIPVNFKGNQVLFDQLFQNLLINAIQYSPKGSIINILLQADSLSIINEGAPFNFSEDKLFSRFSKTIEKDQKGNGLGLAISKKIALVHGFDVSYEYLNSKHHFTILFKKPSQESIS